MTDQSNVFGDQSDQTTPNANPEAERIATLLGSIKNEQGEQKYKTLDDALVALQHSQQYIPQLKTELFAEKSEVEQLREQVAKFGNIDETVQRLLKQQEQPPATTEVSGGLDAEAVQKLIQSHMQQSQAAQLEQKNLDSVVSALTSAYGENANQVIRAKAQATGTTPAALEALAKQNPQLVLALFSQGGAGSPTPSVGGRQGVPPVRVDPGYVKPTKSMLSGVTSKEQAENWRALSKSIYSKHGIEN